MKEKNIFLHFLDYDTQEMFNILPSRYHKHFYDDVKKALNVAILLCYDYCVLPPAFIFESELTRNVISWSKPYIEDNFLRFAIRESDFDTFINTKQKELNTCREMKNYCGYFRVPDKNPKMMDVISHHTINRDKQIGKIWNDYWQNGMDAAISNQEGSIITGIADDGEKKAIEYLRREHENIFDNGVYLWPYLKERGLDKTNMRNNLEFESELRASFQRYYFTPYLEEYNASLLLGIYCFDKNQYFGFKKQAYNYEWFTTFLSNIGLKELLDCKPEQLCKIKNTSDFTDLKEYYFEIVDRDDFLQNPSSGSGPGKIRDEVSRIRNEEKVKEMINKLSKEIKPNKASNVHEPIFIRNQTNITATGAGRIIDPQIKY